MAYPHLNQTSEEMIEKAMSLGSLEGMAPRDAIQKIKLEVGDHVLQTALLFNLCRDGSFACNLQAIYDNQHHIYGFPDLGTDSTFEGPCLMLNGADSFQREICDDKKFYNTLFPKVTTKDIVMLDGAGHGLHFEQPAKVRKFIHDFLLQSETETQPEEQQNEAQRASL